MTFVVLTQPDKKITPAEDAYWNKRKTGSDGVVKMNGYKYNALRKDSEFVYALTEGSYLWFGKKVIVTDDEYFDLTGLSGTVAIGYWFTRDENGKETYEKIITNNYGGKMIDNIDLQSEGIVTIALIEVLSNSTEIFANYTKDLAPDYTLSTSWHGSVDITNTELPTGATRLFRQTLYSGIYQVICSVDLASDPDGYALIKLRADEDTCTDRTTTSNKNNLQVSAIYEASDEGTVVEAYAFLNAGTNTVTRANLSYVRAGV